MSILTNPRSLYFTRIVQLLFAIGFLVTVSYAGVHRGWYDNINGALAVGIIATICTLALTIHALVTSHLKSNPFSGGSRTRTILRLVAEALVFLLWIATAVLQLRKQSGCKDRTIADGIDQCFKDPNEHSNGHRWTDHPTISWDLGIAFDFVEIVSFVISLVLVFKEDRETKVTGGASYA